jgi:hypothetical protein
MTMPLTNHLITIDSKTTAAGQGEYNGTRT